MKKEEEEEKKRKKKILPKPIGHQISSDVLIKAQRSHNFMCYSLIFHNKYHGKYHLLLYRQKHKK